MRRTLPLLLMIGLACLSGCGGAAEATVTGKVTLAGKPLTSGTVVFEGKNGLSTTRIQPDGTYRMDHVPVGFVKISVYWEPPRTGVAQPEEEDFTKIGATAPAPLNPVPAKYTNPETSGLTFTVEPGTQICNLDLR